MRTTTDLGYLLQQAGPALCAYLDDDAMLSDPVVIKDGLRSRTIRCRVRARRSDIASVILKHITADDACGFSEWASLAFLSTLPEADGLAPRFYGGDIAARFFLMEDLGPSRSLEHLLHGDDPAIVQATLQRLATEMARLHAATLARNAEFKVLRKALPAAAELGRRYEAERWLQSQAKTRAWLQAVNVTLPTDFEQCLERVAQLYAEPGPWLALTHGDPAPTNNHIAHDQVRLIDFEYGSLRHALYDITAWNVLCPLPAEWVHNMNCSFRAKLAQGCPAARDEQQYTEAWAHLCSYRALAVLSWIPVEILQHNQPWVGDWSMREAVLTAVSRLRQATADCAELGPVHEAADLLAHALYARWPEFDHASEPLPRWPVLRY